MAGNTFLPQNSVHIVYDVTEEFADTLGSFRVTFKDNEEPNYSSKCDNSSDVGGYESHPECEDCNKIFHKSPQAGDERRSLDQEETMRCRRTLCRKHLRKNNSKHAFDVADSETKDDSNCLSLVSDADISWNNIFDDDEIVKEETRINIEKIPSTCIPRLQCFTCNFSCVEDNDLIIHSKSVHDSLTPFDCYACEECFVKQEVMIGHSRMVHEIDKRIICKICNLRISFKLIATHALACKADKPYRCKHCLKRFATDELKTSHEAGHNQKCSDCNLNFFLDSDYRKHVRTVHQSKRKKSLPEQQSLAVSLSSFERKLKESSKLLPNNLATKISKDEDSARSEPRVDPHNEVEELPQQGTSKDLKQHRKKSKQAPSLLLRKPKTVQKWCPHCPRIFYKLKRLENHCKIIHGSSEIYGCYSCNACFSSQKQRTEHLNDEHVSIHGILCKFCSSYVKTEITMNVHILTCRRSLKQTNIQGANDEKVPSNNLLPTYSSLNQRKGFHHGLSKKTMGNLVFNVQLQPTKKGVTTMQTEGDYLNTSTKQMELDINLNKTLTVDTLSNNKALEDSDSDINNDMDIEPPEIESPDEDIEPPEIESPDEDIEPPFLEPVYNPHNLPSSITSSSATKSVLESRDELQQRSAIETQGTREGSCKAVLKDGPPVLEPVTARSLKLPCKLNKNKSLLENYCDYCHKIYVDEFELLEHCKTIHCTACPFVCYTCDQQFGDATSRLGHMQQKHYMAKGFICKMCGIVTETEYEIKYHMLQCVKKPICCECCSFRFHTQMELDIHQEEVATKPNQCQCCPYRFVTEDELKLHEVVHVKPEEELQLKLEEEPTQILGGADNTNLPLLENDTDDDGETEEGIQGSNETMKLKPAKQYEKKEQCTNEWCPECYETFASNRLLIKHCKEKHKTTAVFGCYCCHARFQNKIRRKHHLVTKHKKGTHSCKICNNTMPVSNLAEHIIPCGQQHRAQINKCANVPLTNASVKCMRCGEKFENLYFLNLHDTLFHEKESVGVKEQNLHHVDSMQIKGENLECVTVEGDSSYSEDVPLQDRFPQAECGNRYTASFEATESSMAIRYELKACSVVVENFLMDSCPEETDDHIDVDMPNSQISTNNSHPSVAISMDNANHNISVDPTTIETDNGSHNVENYIFRSEASNLEEKIADYSDDDPGYEATSNGPSTDMDSDEEDLPLSALQNNTSDIISSESITNDNCKLTHTEAPLASSNFTNESNFEHQRTENPKDESMEEQQTDTTKIFDLSNSCLNTVPQAETSDVVGHNSLKIESSDLASSDNTTDDSDNSFLNDGPTEETDDSVSLGTLVPQPRTQPVTGLHMNSELLAKLFLKYNVTDCWVVLEDFLNDEFLLEDKTCDEANNMDSNGPPNRDGRSPSRESSDTPLCNSLTNVAADDIDETSLNENTAVMKENTAVMKETAAILKENTAVVKENIAVIKENTAITKENTKSLEDGLNSDSSTFKENANPTDFGTEATRIEPVSTFNEKDGPNCNSSILKENVNPMDIGTEVTPIEAVSTFNAKDIPNDPISDASIQQMTIGHELQMQE